MQNAAAPSNDPSMKPKVSLASFEPTSQTNHQQTQGSLKSTWLITYASGSPDITKEMLEGCRIKCNECYTTTWRESKYTLIHLTYPNRKRASSLEHAMAKMLREHGVSGNAIHGYDMLSSNTKDDRRVTDHPGFKRIVQNLNDKKDELRIWMEHGDVATNRSGILWSFLDGRDPRTLSKTQLVERAAQHSDLKAQHKTLQDAYEALQGAFAAQGRELVHEKTQSMQFFNQLCEKTDECTRLKNELNARPKRPRDA